MRHPVCVAYDRSHDLDVAPSMIRNAGDPSRAPLWDALALHAVARPVVAIVGAGGKTSLAYALAREAAALGGRAIVTGTTRFTAAPHGWPRPPLIEAPPGQAAALVVSAAIGGAVVVAGVEPQPAGRLAPLSGDEVGALALADGVDAVFVEADGSRARPFKAPGEHEPVIPAAATHVVVVVGASALGQPVDGGSVHRPERVRELVPGLSPAALCDAGLIARVLAHEDGGRKHLGGRPFAVVVNQADTHLEAAQAIARAVRALGMPCIVAALRDQERPVRDGGV